MDNHYIENKCFQGVKFDSNTLVSEYENCEFIACNFAGLDLGNIKFIHCLFIDCNLSLAQIKNITFDQAQFKLSKLLGVNFSECNPFNLGLSFEGCTLNDSSFYGCKISKTTFTICSLMNVDFENADLSKSSFEESLLSGSNFYQTNLEGADFYSADDFNIDLDLNKIKGAKFSYEGLPGLLAKYKLKIKL